MTCSKCGAQIGEAIADACDGMCGLCYDASSADPVQHPAHYTHAGIECLDVIEALGLGYHLGNALKYLWRAGHKGDAIEDLRKARFYLDREISRRMATAPQDAPRPEGG